MRNVKNQTYTNLNFLIKKWLNFEDARSLGLFLNSIVECKCYEIFV